jgi:hypothetical protein
MQLQYGLSRIFQRLAHCLCRGLFAAVVTKLCPVSTFGHSLRASTPCVRIAGQSWGMGHHMNSDGDRPLVTWASRVTPQAHFSDRCVSKRLLMSASGISWTGTAVCFRLSVYRALVCQSTPQNGSFKSHEVQPPLRHVCGPSTAGAWVKCGPTLGADQPISCPCLTASPAPATPFATMARLNRMTFSRLHVAGSVRAGPGVACVRATLWAVGSGRRPCVGGAHG